MSTVSTKTLSDLSAEASAKYLSGAPIAVVAGIGPSILKINKMRSFK
jgi:hypothetical protein